MWRQKKTQIYNTIQGFCYNNENFFDCLYLPSVLDRDYMITTIMCTCGLLEVAIPDPNIMSKAVEVWSKHRAVDWLRMYKALYAEYNPIHNYDKTSDITNTGTQSESHTDTNDTGRGLETRTDDDNTRTDNLQDKTDGTHRTQYGSTDTRTDNLQQVERPNTTDTRTDNLHETQGGGEITTHENTAYNDGLSATARDTLVKNGLTTDNTGTQTNAKTGTVTTDNTGTQTNAKTGADTETIDDTVRHTGTQTNNRDITHTEIENTLHQNTGNSSGQNSNIMAEYTRGNIGVKSTQSMILEEISLRYENNIYEIIAKEFKEKFCNLIYIL